MREGNDIIYKQLYMINKSIMKLTIIYTSSIHIVEILNC